MKGRPDRLTDEVRRARLDALLISDLVNVRYVTGYTGTNGLAMVGPRTRAFITDFRYVEQAAAEVHPSFDRRRAPQDLLGAIGDALPGGEVRLGFDDAQLSVARHAKLRDLLPSRVEFVPAGGLVERLRAVKEADEVDAIHEATKLADASVEKLLYDGLVGRTERELAISLEHDLRMRGAQGPSFDTIIAAGPHGALPHATPREIAIRRGDMVVIDWGARLDGYCSDCTRTVAAGIADAEAEEVYGLVLAAQLAGLQAVRPEAHGKAVDAVARNMIVTAGHGEHYGHGLGHGVGMDIHEAPRLSEYSEDTLAVGNAVTVEPGIYVPGRFGVRIEDLVVVTLDGCDLLTSLPKRLLITE